jgi:hypothetical protein
MPEERGYWEQTTDAFQKTFDELHPQGWRLKRIKGYAKNGVSRYDSVWHKPAPAPRFYCQHDLDSKGYDAQAARMKAADYTEVLKSTWKINGEDRFWAVWEVK